jgi:mannitol/fructose-specific phosphotransferase system IIA component (Ntr-type)
MRILLEALQAGRLFELTETSKRGAFEFLGRVLEAIPEIPDDSGVVEAMFAREATGNTAIAPGVACPHARVEGINAEIFCALGWSSAGIDYEAEDGNRVNLVVAYCLASQRPSPPSAGSNLCASVRLWVKCATVSWIG